MDRHGSGHGSIDGSGHESVHGLDPGSVHGLGHGSSSGLGHRSVHGYLCVGSRELVLLEYERWVEDLGDVGSGGGGCSMGQPMTYVTSHCIFASCRNSKTKTITITISHFT
ncbi:hypothetical protein QVD17_06660 [Tagetes erecta]|uniref:Uncharacterized protein n=1 Tax=Tagetes erecta TaxID=13708 RepID=A0AAD8LJT1_TARER|nr:hypothetical protein QVD17_06660 [Tagetes erecta]